MGYTVSAELKVAEAVQAVLRGMRLSEDSAVAEAAIKRERELEPQIETLRKEATKQPELSFQGEQRP